MHEDSLDWGIPDAGRSEQMHRALNVSGAGTVLLQTFIDKSARDLSNREPGLWTALEHLPGEGDAWYVNRRTPGTTGGAWVADTDTATEENGSWAQTSFTYRTLLSRLNITRKLMATGRSYGDVLGKELMLKVGDLVGQLEETGCLGDNAATANRPSGWLTLINATSGQVIANTSASAGDAVVLSKLDQAIDAVRGSNSRKLIVASRAGRRKLNAALQAQQSFNDVVEIRGGFRVQSYDDIPIVTSTGMSDACVWSGTSVTAFTGGATTAIMVLNLDECFWGELTPVSTMPLARGDSQKELIDLFADVVCVFANTKGGAILGGVLA